MPTTNTDTAWKLTLVKSFTYRNASEEFSNSYHFTGEAPTDHAGWEAFARLVAQQESGIYIPDVKVIRAYGYLAGSNASVAQIDFAIDTPIIAGQLVAVGQDHSVSGDVAAWVRWLTPDDTSTGKHIYLRKYFHGILGAANDQDTPSAGTRDALGAFAAALKAGIGAPERIICGPRGAPAGLVAVGPYLTTRTLKRRGKRPPN